MKKKIKVLHVVGGHPSAGAFKGTYILHRALIDSNIDSTILSDCSKSIGEKNLGEDNSIIYLKDNFLSNVLNQISKLIEKILKSIFLKSPRSTFTLGIFGFDITKFKEYQKADIIHLHWLSQGFIKLKSLKKISKPLVWTMRDMWVFTGGPHYTCDFEDYEQSKFSNFLKKFKKNNYPHHTQFIAISNWLKLEAKKSSVLKSFEIKKIDNNVDIENFKVIDQMKAKQLLNIKTKKKIILYGSQNPQSERKGWDIFIETLNKLDKSNFFLIIFGNFWSKSVLDRIGIEYKSFGFVNDRNLLNIIYSSSDMFVFPSIQEAFGKTWAEAMACGLPIVCFNNTGASDYVSHKVNGFIVDTIGSEDLKKGIDWMSKETDKKKNFQNLSQKQLLQFDPKNSAKKYIKLYSELL